MNHQIVDSSADQDLQILPQMITAWKQVQEESAKEKQRW